MKPALMLMGTGSDVGKSTLVAGLARAFHRRGLKVMPFKPQNMSNNAAVTVDGGEIGRAQALQARAAGVSPSVHMNPVLLKPESETGAQVVVQGRRVASLRAAEYARFKPTLMSAVLESFRRLETEADLVLVEGAGSASEVNLRAGDIANFGFAEAADLPVVLVGDIERGGVIASLVGTKAVIAEDDSRRIAGYIVNKFRGDPALFAGGMTTISALTGWRSFGLLPFVPETGMLPAEDSLGLARPPGEGKVTIAVPVTGRISNFDDLDPLAAEPGVRLVFVRAGEVLPPEARLVILPGSKSTIADLAFFRAQSWDIDLKAHVRRGGHVLGLCGGYQMLGRRIADPDGVEGHAAEVEGLGLLDVETVMTADKVTLPAIGIHCASGERVTGYEIHLGTTAGPACARPMLMLGGTADGALSSDGSIAGCYLHGLFAADGFRKAFLAGFGLSSSLRFEQQIEAALDALADHVERHLDLDALLALAQNRASSNTSAPNTHAAVTST